MVPVLHPPGQGTSLARYAAMMTQLWWSRWESNPRIPHRSEVNPRLGLPNCSAPCCPCSVLTGVRIIHPHGRTGTLPWWAGRLSPGVAVVGGDCAPLSPASVTGHPPLLCQHRAVDIVAYSPPIVATPGLPSAIVSTFSHFTRTGISPSTPLRSGIVHRSQVARGR